MKRVEDYKFFTEVSTLTDKGGYSEWLWATVHNIYLPQSERGNSDFEAFLKEYRHDSVVTGLAHVYDKLTNTSQEFFRQAIGEVFLKQTDKDAPREAFEDLIYLLGKVQAVESLEILVSTLGHGLLGKRHGEYLSWSTFAILQLLAPKPPVKEVTLGLISSPYVDGGYLLGAIGILVKCDPFQTDTFLSNLAPRIASLRGEIQGLDQDEQDAYSKAANDLIIQVQRYAPANNLSIAKQVLYG